MNQEPKFKVGDKVVHISSRRVSMLIIAVNPDKTYKCKWLFNGESKISDFLEQELEFPRGPSVTTS